jgi:hypothetical protein
MPIFYRSDLEEPHDYEVFKKDEPPSAAPAKEDGGNFLDELFLRPFQKY